MVKNVLFVLSAIAAADTSTHAVDTFDFKASRIGFGFFSIKIAIDEEKKNNGNEKQYGI